MLGVFLLAALLLHTWCLTSDRTLLQVKDLLSAPSTSTAGYCGIRCDLIRDQWELVSQRPLLLPVYQLSVSGFSWIPGLRLPSAGWFDKSRVETNFLSSPLLSQFSLSLCLVSC